MRKDKFGKIAVARTTAIQGGTISTTDARVFPLSQSLGVTYDANKNVASNQTVSRITALENQIATLQAQVTALLTHTHNYDDDGVAEVTGEPN